MLLQGGTGTVPWIRGSFGQCCPSPDTPFPSANGPVFPKTGPTASSCASAKAENGIWRGCGGAAALQRLNTPYLGKTGWPRTSLPGSQCVGLPLPQGGQRGEALRRGGDAGVLPKDRRKFLGGNGNSPLEHRGGEEERGREGRECSRRWVASALRVGTRNGSWDMLGEGVVAAWGVCARVTEPPVIKSTQMSPSSAETHWLGKGKAGGIQTSVTLPPTYSVCRR